MPPASARKNLVCRGRGVCDWSFTLASVLTVSDLGRTDCLVEAAKGWQLTPPIEILHEV